MNEQIKAEWLRRLRSGEVKQGYRKLRINDTRCCLGVLCDVVGVEWKEDEHIPSQGVFYIPLPEHSNSDDDYTGWATEEEALPDFVVKAAGVNSKDPYVTYQGRQFRLSELNDGPQEGGVAGDLTRKSLTFAQIADLIEEQL